MANVNKVIILGRLGQDAEKRVTNSNREMLTFSIATTRFWKGQDGERQEATEWHEVVHWARRQGGLDALREYLVKGKEVYVEGELRTRQYEKEGQQHKRTEVHAQRVELTGGRRDGGNGGGQRTAGGQDSRQDSRQDNRSGYERSAPQNHENPPPTDIDLDDIPF